MKLEKEITVLVETDYDNLVKILKTKGFNIIEKYQVNDIYMINENIDLNTLDNLSILQKCILVRDIVGIEKQLLYKYKKYNKFGEIIEQGKVKCPILNIGMGIEFMNSINYKKLFEINDECIVYSNNEIEIVVQIINDKYIFIEMEDKCEYIKKEYSTIEEMIKELEKYNLPYNKNNYFVKKAEIILENIRNGIL